MRLLHPLVVLLVSSVLAGCGVVTDPTEVAPDEYVASPAPNPRAAAVFGQERVDDAVAELTEFALTEAFPPALLDPQQEDYSHEDLAGDSVTQHLTPEVAQEWRALVDAALDGDPEARSAVQGMRFYDVERLWTLPEDTPVVARQQIVDVAVDVDSTDGPGNELLVVSFVHEAALEYRDEGRLVGFDVEKQMTYRLTPSPVQNGDDWLIADFDGDFDVIDWS